MNLKDTPIQRKLQSIILLTCAIVLVLMCGAYIVIEYVTFRETIRQKVSTLGIVVASNSSAAVAFDSEKDANEILNALRADAHIVAASLYDKEGQLFAKYPGNLPSTTLPERPGKEGYYFSNGYLIGFEPVVQENKQLGILYIKSDLKAINQQLQINVLIALFLIAVALLVAYLLSRVLQRSISEPILALERKTRIVSETNDYSIRAEKLSNDELGALTDAFNQMLGQIEKQNLEIIAATQESSKLAAIVESSGDAIIGTDLNHITTSWNSSAERLFGHTAEEMIGQSLSAFLSHSLKIDTLKLVEDGQTDPLEIEWLSSERKIKWISLTISPIRDNDHRIIGLSQIARDITAQKKNEKKIIENEEQLRLATQAAELGTFDLDLLKGTIDLSTRCKELLQLPQHALVRNTNDFLINVHEDDRERIKCIIEGDLDKNDGEQNFDLDLRTIRSDGKLRWARAKGKIFLGAKGEPIRSIGAVLDITAKKQEEIKKNDFIAIISHELKTPLTSIKSFIQILLSKAKKGKDSFEVHALSRADIQTNKMASMITDFLSLARIEEGKMTLVKRVFDMKPLFEDIVNEAAFLYPNHTIKVEICEEAHVNADKEKIGQVLTNLITNAIKYSPEGSIVTLGCEKKSGKVKVYVEDEGIGISKSDQKKLFNRFYRVENEKKTTISGFGIGLYIVSEILRYHKSRIEVESEEGRGSTFYFELDLVEGEI